MDEGRFDEVRRALAENGYVAGAAAGSWLIDGSTSTETAVAWILSQTGADDSILNQLPDSPLSGEWADSPTPKDVLAEVDVDIEDVADIESELLDAWETGFRQGSLEEVLHSATAMLGLRFVRSDDPRPGDAARVNARSKEFAAEWFPVKEAPAEPVGPHGWDILEVTDGVVVDEVVGQSYGESAQEALLRFAADVGMVGRVTVDWDLFPTRGSDGILHAERKPLLWHDGNGVLTARPKEAEQSTGMSFTAEEWGHFVSSGLSWNAYAAEMEARS